MAKPYSVGSHKRGARGPGAGPKVKVKGYKRKVPNRKHLRKKK